MAKKGKRFVMPVRYVVITIEDGGDYDGASFKLARKMPLTVLFSMQKKFDAYSVSGDATEMEDAIRYLGDHAILEWNLEDPITDAEGNPTYVTDNSGNYVLDESGAKVEQTRVIPVSGEALLEFPADFTLRVLKTWMDTISDGISPLAAELNNGDLSPVESTLTGTS